MWYKSVQKYNFTFKKIIPLQLGDENFKKVKEFLKRFASIPDILELDHLTVSGNVNFGKKVVLKGTVIIIANHGEQIDIPSGAILGKIFDHEIIR